MRAGVHDAAPSGRASEACGGCHVRRSPPRPPAPRQRVFTPSVPAPPAPVSPLSRCRSPRKKKPGPDHRIVSHAAGRCDCRHRHGAPAVHTSAGPAAAGWRRARPRPRPQGRRRRRRADRWAPPRRFSVPHAHAQLRTPVDAGPAFVYRSRIAGRRAIYSFVFFFLFPSPSFFSPASTRSQPLADCTALSVSDLTPPADGIVFLPFFSPVRIPPTVSFWFSSLREVSLLGSNTYRRFAPTPPKIRRTLI